MGKKTNNKGNNTQVSTKPINTPKIINRNGKNSMRLTKIDKK